MPRGVPEPFSTRARSGCGGLSGVHIASSSGWRRVSGRLRRRMRRGRRGVPRRGEGQSGVSIRSSTRRGISASIRVIESRPTVATPSSCRDLERSFEDVRFDLMRCRHPISDTSSRCAASCTTPIPATRGQGSIATGSHVAFQRRRVGDRVCERVLCPRHDGRPPRCLERALTELARLEHGEERQGLGCEAAREADPPGPRGSRCARLAPRPWGLRPASRGSVLLQIEVRDRARRVREHVARRLEDRHRPRAGVRVRALPRVQRARVEAALAISHTPGA